MTPARILCPVCPMCGDPGLALSIGDWIINDVQRFCQNDDCGVLIWDPTTTALGNLSDMGQVQVESTPVTGPTALSTTWTVPDGPAASG